MTEQKEAQTAPKRTQGKPARAPRRSHQLSLKEMKRLGLSPGPYGKGVS